MFGKMNEDLHQGEYNAEIGEDGFIRTSLIKNQIVGVYEGVEVDETEGATYLRLREVRGASGG